MKTVNIEGKRLKTTYKTSSGKTTRASFAGKTFNQGLSCDVYDVEDGEHKALVLCTASGSDLLKSVTVISNKEYEEIADLYDPFAGGLYHTALVEKCGAENLLKLA